MEENYWNWRSPSADTQAVDNETRERWFEQLKEQIAEDPTFSFVGSGDRIMVALIDDIDDEGYAHITVEDCIVTRRRFAKVKCKDSLATSKEYVRKVDVGIALADVENHLKRLDATSISMIGIWREEMWKWLAEIENLTY